MTELFTPAISDQRKIELSVELSIAFMSGARSSYTVEQIPDIVASCFTAINGIVNPAPIVVEEKREPAVPIRKSVTPDYIVCLEDGKKFKSLKRHLRTHFNMSPEEYREKWNLPADYPMVAPSYSATRSQLAKDNGLGKK